MHTRPRTQSLCLPSGLRSWASSTKRDNSMVHDISLHVVDAGRHGVSVGRCIVSISCPLRESVEDKYEGLLHAFSNFRAKTLFWPPKCLVFSVSRTQNGHIPSSPCTHVRFASKLQTSSKLDDSRFRCYKHCRLRVKSQPHPRITLLVRPEVLSWQALAPMLTVPRDPDVLVSSFYCRAPSSANDDRTDRCERLSSPNASVPVGGRKSSAQ